LAWTVRWERRAIKDMAKLGSVERERVARFILDRIASRDNPREIGEALVGSFAGYWRYRVGDYRVVASIDDGAITILIVQVGNRREVYR